MKAAGVPRSMAKSQTKQRGSNQGTKSKKSGSCIRTAMEFFFFACWIIFTGIGGYFVGHSPMTQVCPPPLEPEVVKLNKPKCVQREGLGSGIAIGAAPKEDGYTLDELTRMWKCSHAVANFSQANKKLFPKSKDLDKTKWKSILTVEPKAFFDKYLSQYPGDTRAVQPVVVFSHKPLNDMKDIPEVCRVLDVAIVPDTPGVCVAVTETYHDVASYHMLHADRQPDGTFALTANSLEGRELPEESHYAGARALLLQYFDNVEYVQKAVRAAPKFGQNKVAVGCLLEDVEELVLFKNSLESAMKAGVSKTKFAVFTTNSAVNAGLQGLGIKVIFLPNLAYVGTTGAANVGPKFRRFFLLAWLAFAVANSNNKMMWQSPGTVWLNRPDNIINIVPIVEILWTFKGRKDKRAAPFFASFDFFVPTGAERPIHLMHEILLHFDLVLAWGSLDAVASYRLSENNARYGTTTHILPPYKVLHTDLMAGNAKKIRDAVLSSDRPMAVVVPHEGLAPSDAQKMLKEAGLWFTH